MRGQGRPPSSFESITTTGSTLATTGSTEHALLHRGPGCGTSNWGSNTTNPLHPVPKVIVNTLGYESPCQTVKCIQNAVFFNYKLYFMTLNVFCMLVFTAYYVHNRHSVSCICHYTMSTVINQCLTFTTDLFCQEKAVFLLRNRILCLKSNFQIKMKWNPTSQMDLTQTSPIWYYEYLKMRGRGGEIKEKLRWAAEVIRLKWIPEWKY